MDEFQKIETDRFFLRKLNAADATEKYLNWITDEFANKYILNKASFFSLESLVEYIEEKNARDNVLFLGIFTNNNIHIGNIKYEPINVNAGFAVMGILIGDSEFRGVNAAGEVIKYTASYLKNVYSISKIVLGVERDNFSAIKAYERIGFTIDHSDRYFPVGDGVCMVLMI